MFIFFSEKNISEQNDLRFCWDTVAKEGLKIWGAYCTIKNSPRVTLYYGLLSKYFKTHEFSISHISIIEVPLFLFIFPIQSQDFMDRPWHYRTIQTIKFYRYFLIVKSMVLTIKSIVNLKSQLHVFLPTKMKKISQISVYLQLHACHLETTFLHGKSSSKFDVN